MDINTNITAIILAGGVGSRLTAGGLSDVPKQYLKIGGEYILSRSIEAFLGLSFVGEVIVVVSGGWMEYCRENIVRPLETEYSIEIKLIEGGKDRQESSLNGVRAATMPFVMIHDGARPFVSREDIGRLYEAVVASGAATLGVPITDTIKEVEDGQIARTVPRDSLMGAVTPQAFSRKKLLLAHEFALKSGFVGTDDTSLLEYINERVMMLASSRKNIKITTQEDLVYAEFLAGRD